MTREFSNKKILITGGAGFIGSNLCEELVNLGNDVVCLDNFSTGKRENIQSLIDNNRFTLIEGDIREIETCYRASKEVDYVLHQAALGSVPRSIKNPVITNEVNIVGFLNMLVAAKDSGVKRFIYAASSSTYGDSNILPKVENKIGRPLSPYAITKYTNELYASVFSEIYGIETIGLRYFNVFGRKQDPDGAYAAVIPKFVKKLINGESPIINGDGSFSRDFTYIDNVIQANLLSLTTKDLNSLNTVYNIAYGERITLNELVTCIKASLNKYDANVLNIKVIHGKKREGDIPHSHANIDKARRLLNYNPIYSLSSGIEKAVDWYWENLK